MASDLAKATQVSKGERHLRLAERLVLASGIILFCFLVARLGADNILANLRLVGWGIFLIIAAEILAFLANTLGWRAAFPRQETVPSFGQLLLARIAGDGVNYLTPTATMGGEFVRVRMLQAQAPVTSLAASVMVAKLTQTIGLLVFVSCGLLLVIDELRLPSSVKWGILASLVAFTAIIGWAAFSAAAQLADPCPRLRHPPPATKILGSLPRSSRTARCRNGEGAPGVFISYFPLCRTFRTWVHSRCYRHLLDHLVLWDSGKPETCPRH